MFAFITKIVRTISLSKVAMWSIAAILGIIFYTVYENRTILLALVSDPVQTNQVGLSYEVGTETQRIIKERVSSDARIAGVEVFSTDLRLNEARSLYFYGPHSALNAVDETARQSGNARLPIFTGSEESNVEMIKMINGQFSCVKYANSIQGRLYPETKKGIDTICRASVPSYYGYFSGYISVMLTTDPGSEYKSQLKLMIEKLSTDVYFRDVLTTQRQEKSTAIMPKVKGS